MSGLAQDYYSYYWCLPRSTLKTIATGKPAPAPWLISKQQASQEPQAIDLMDFIFIGAISKPFRNP